MWNVIVILAHMSLGPFNIRNNTFLHVSISFSLPLPLLFLPPSFNPSSPSVLIFPSIEHWIVNGSPKVILWPTAATASQECPVAFFLSLNMAIFRPYHHAPGNYLRHFFFAQNMPYTSWSRKACGNSRVNCRIIPDVLSEIWCPGVLTRYTYVMVK